MHKAEHSRDTEAETELAESEPHVEQDAEPGEDHGKDGVEAEFLTDSRTHVVAGDDFALLTGLLEGLGHLEFKLGIVGGAHAHLVGVGGSTAERADLGTRDAGSGEGLAQVLFVPAVVLVLNRIDLATGEVDAEVESLHGDACDGSDDENQGHEAEAATVRDNLEVRFVDGLETVTDRKRGAVALGQAPVEDGAGHRDGAEEGSEDTDSKRKTETLHGTGTDFVEDKAGKHGRQVGVQDGAEGAVVTLGHGGAGGKAVLEFFTDTFVDNHVRVEGHTHHEDEARDTGEREGRVEHGHHGGGHEGVDDHTEASDKAAQAVVGHHEHQAEDKTDGTGTEALDDVFFTEGGTDAAAFDNLHRGLEGTGTEHDGEAVGFGHVFEAGNLCFAVRDTVTDDRGRNHLVVEHDGHLLADVRGSHGRELLGADTGELEAHGHFTGVGTVAHAVRAGVGDVVTAHFGTAAEEVEALGLDLGVALHRFEAAAEGEGHVTRNQLLHGFEFENLLDRLDAFFGDETAVTEGEVVGAESLPDHGCRYGVGGVGHGAVGLGSLGLGDLAAQEFFVGELLCGIGGRLGAVSRGDGAVLGRRIGLGGIAGGHVGGLAGQVLVNERNDLGELFAFCKNLEFELGGGTHEVLCGRIVHTGKFDQDAVVAGRGNLRFGKAELVNAVTDDFQGLGLDILDIVGRLEASLVDLEGDARTAGKVKAEIDGLGAQFRICLEEGLLFFTFLGVNLNRRPYGIGRECNDEENDKFSHAEFIFFHL